MGVWCRVQTLCLYADLMADLMPIYEGLDYLLGASWS